MLSRVCDAWARYRSVMVQMPTGTGKTVLLAEVLRRIDGEVLVVAHRRELLAQITATLEHFGIGGDR
ncbi:MAG: DEAD/DEAH box helicase family protein, partial [Prevotella sp.]|nr:DEAD/DEAH box helicase family protein [Prevotella sp.]